MQRQRRIALLSEHASPLARLGGADAGGQNVYIDEVSHSLARLGYAVDVFTRRDDDRLPGMVELGEGVRVVHLDAGPPRPIPKDDIWPHMPAFRTGVARFMVRDGARYDVLHGNFWMSGWAAAELRRSLKIPAAQIFHATGKTKQRHQGPADTSPAERIPVELEVVRGVDRLIAQCPAERDELLHDYGAPAERVAVIPSAVNVEQFRPAGRDEARRAVGLGGSGPIIAYVGRLLPRKDIRNIVRALPLLRGSLAEARLLVVGGETAEPDPAATPEIGELMRLAEWLGVRDRVIFMGKRQPSELRLFYSAGDVVVTTPWYEPFGLTPLEAMACGRPVIGSAVGGIAFTVQDGVTGRLVPPREPAALAGALAELLGDDSKRGEMGRAARRRVEREFTWATVALRTAALYEELIAADAAGAPLLERTAAR